MITISDYCLPEWTLNQKLNSIKLWLNIVQLQKSICFSFFLESQQKANWSEMRGIEFVSV